MQVDAVLQALVAQVDHRVARVDRSPLGLEDLENADAKYAKEVAQLKRQVKELQVSNKALRKQTIPEPKGPALLATASSGAEETRKERTT